jgi:hypothetical protein
MKRWRVKTWFKVLRYEYVNAPTEEGATDKIEAGITEIDESRDLSDDHIETLWDTLEEVDE